MRGVRFQRSAQLDVRGRDRHRHLFVPAAFVDPVTDRCVLAWRRPRATGSGIHAGIQ